MLDRLNIPQDLQHLIEKRGQQDRRQEQTDADADEQAVGEDAAADQAPERRQSDRRRES